MEDYEKCIEDLNNEWKMTKKRHRKMKEIMKSFPNRQTWILNQDPEVSEILTSFPCLEEYDDVRLHLFVINLFLNIDGRRFWNDCWHIQGYVV